MKVVMRNLSLKNAEERKVKRVSGFFCISLTLLWLRFGCGCASDGWTLQRRVHRLPLCFFSSSSRATSHYPRLLFWWLQCLGMQSITSFGCFSMSLCLDAAREPSSSVHASLLFCSSVVLCCSSKSVVFCVCVVTPLRTQWTMISVVCWKEMSCLSAHRFHFVCDNGEGESVWKKKERRYTVVGREWCLGMRGRRKRDSWYE